MKRWLLRLGLAALTFTTGYGVHFFTRNVVINKQPSMTVKEPRLEVLPYCQVARNPEIYDQREILVNARVSVSGAGIYVFEDCDSVDALAANVLIDENSPLTGPGSGYNLLLSNNKPKTQTAQALIKGRFHKQGMSCWLPEFLITAEKIELLTPLTNYKPPQTKGPSIRLKH